MDEGGDLKLHLKDLWRKIKIYPQCVWVAAEPTGWEHGTTVSKKAALSPRKAKSAKVTSVTQKRADVRFIKILSCEESHKPQKCETFRVFVCIEGTGCQRK